MQSGRAGRSGRAQLLVVALPTMQSSVGAHSLALQISQKSEVRMVTWLQHCNVHIYKMDQQKLSQGLMNVIGEQRSCMFAGSSV